MKSRPVGDRVRTSDGADRESQIVAAATRIFQERGYTATTIQAIAEEVGILKGSIYYYIDTKEDLLFRISEDVHTGLAASLDGLGNAGGDPVEQIRGFIGAHVAFCAENLAATRVFLHEFRALGDERRRQIVAERDASERRLRDLVAEAQRQGLIRDDLDSELVVLAIFGMMNWMYQWYRPSDRLGPDEIGRTLADLALDGLTCAGGGRRVPQPSG
jgi:AcrR family transcriptional regulator